MDLALPQFEAPPGQTSMRPALRHLIANRQSAEARAMFVRLAEYLDRRVGRNIRRRSSDLLTDADKEEIVADVLTELMSGTLATFRGDTEAELLGFVGRIGDRSTWRAARKRLRERDTLRTSMAEEVRSWNAILPRPDEAARMDPPCPLVEEDRAYLETLLSSGSQASLARDLGVSRAAVSQRIQRIRRRIASMSRLEQSAAEAWFRRTALAVHPA